MIVNSSTATYASVLCGRVGYVGILYTKKFFGLRLVNTEFLHVFQQTPLQLY